jgi:hypothetical protein
VAKAILLAQFLRAQAWWRLDGAGPSALRVARSVVSLLDTVAYLRDVSDDHPDLLALEAAGCFHGGMFDPGPEGADIIRDWQLADQQSAGPRDLLAVLAAAAARTPPGLPTLPAPSAAPSPAGNPPIVIPPQAGPLPHELTSGT